MISHLEQGARKPWHSSRVPKTCSQVSGGLRYAATTGYYLAALQADARSLPFPVLIDQFLNCPMALP